MSQSLSSPAVVIGTLRVTNVKYETWYTYYSGSLSPDRASFLSSSSTSVAFTSSESSGEIVHLRRLV